MKWYQIFYAILLFWAPLKAEELPKVRLSEIVAENQNSANPAPSQYEIDETKPSVEPEDGTPPQIVHAATESYESAFMKTLIILVGLLALIILTVWMFRKISHGRLRSFNYMKSVKILEKRPLSPKTMLYLIEVGGKQVLIAESQLEVQPITTVDMITSDKDL